MISKADINNVPKNVREGRTVRLDGDAAEKLFRLKLLFAGNKTYREIVNEAIKEYYDSHKTLIDTIRDK